MKMRATEIITKERKRCMLRSFVSLREIKSSSGLNKKKKSLSAFTYREPPQTVLAVHWLHQEQLSRVSLLGILDQQAPYEFLGQLTGIAEVFLVKVVVDGGDVGEGLLLGLAQEW